MSVEEDIEERLRVLEADGLLRSPPVLGSGLGPRVTIDGRPVLVFCSNDYLGLSGHPELVAAGRAALSDHGVGAGASRLISGTSEAHRQAEEELAALVRRPAALLFSSGYAANVGALSALLSRDDVVFSDRLNHASLIDGMRLSRARTYVYPHADADGLAELLVRHRSEGRRAWVVTDTLFSMDGDQAPLRRLRELCDRHDAALFVDEAHALGVIGRGRGLADHLGVVPDALVGTLGKAAGLAGAFVAGSRSLRTLLENRARSYVFSTAPPAAWAQMVVCAARLLLGADDRRATVRRHASRIRSALADAGWSVAAGEGAIVPVHVGDAAETMQLSRNLLERGIFVQGIRPPTVPAGTSRLRVVPTAAHSDDEVDHLLGCLARARLS